MYEIFDNATDNEKIHLFFMENPNYKVIQANGPDDVICIFFSSNSLYLPNTYSAFHAAVVERDRYEWEHLTEDPMLSRIAGTFIFVRDIYKNWWIEGLNGICDSQDKMMELFKKLTAGKRVLTVGTSAGGYAAILFGAQLQAERIFAFSSQIDLHIYNKTHPIKYFSEYVDASRAKAEMDLYSAIRDYCGALYYLYPCLCGEDIDQVQRLTQEEFGHIRMLPVRRNKHGRTVLPISILKFLSMTKEQQEEIYQCYCHRQINPYEFLFRTSGFFPGVKYLLLRLKESVMKRIRRK